MLSSDLKMEHSAKIRWQFVVLILLGALTGAAFERSLEADWSMRNTVIFGFMMVVTSIALIIVLCGRRKVNLQSQPKVNLQSQPKHGEDQRAN